MPTTVTSSSGTVYHLWQLPELSSPEPSESIAFNTLRNDLGDGYRSQVLFGSNTGLRSWSLRLPTLASIDVLPNTVTGINGESVSREQYVWDLYCEQQVTGEPFVYTSPRNGQYYLVEFVDEKLTYEQARVKLYSTGLELRQVRISGETVFDVSKVSGVWGWYKGALNSGTTWIPTTGSVNFTATGDVIETTYNSKPILRFNSVSTDGRLSAPAATNVTVYDLFMVVKAREATFGQTSGFFTDNAAATANYIIYGLNGQANVTIIGTDYEKNGVSDTAPPLPGPMEAWAVLHVQNTSGNTIARPQVGQRDSGTTGGAEIDVGEVIVTNTQLSKATIREITESLMVKWGVA